MAELIIAGVVFGDADGRVLVVRKRGTQAFMLPGGKVEAGESARDAAVREVREELELELTAETLTELGVWRGAAANEPDTTIASTVFTAPLLRTTPAPAAEIAELRWIAPDRPPAELVLAPLVLEFVIPQLAITVENRAPRSS